MIYVNVASYQLVAAKNALSGCIVVVPVHFNLT